jgi:hypothetical protein
MAAERPARIASYRSCVQVARCQRGRLHPEAFKESWEPEVERRCSRAALSIVGRQWIYRTAGWGAKSTHYPCSLTLFPNAQLAPRPATGLASRAAILAQCRRVLWRYRFLPGLPSRTSREMRAQFAPFSRAIRL